MRALLAIFLVLPALAAASPPVRIESKAGRGTPVLYRAQFADDFNPDSVRIRAEASGALVPGKVEWRAPEARISFRSTGAGAYTISFSGTTRLVEPAMVGAGERISYGRGGVRSRLSVGLWASPAPVDIDGDGDMDLIVSCTDHPSNGIYLFRNIGSNRQPLFDRALWLGPGKKDLVAADFNGDGLIDLVTSGGYFSDVRRNRLSRFVPVKLPRSYHVIELAPNPDIIAGLKGGFIKVGFAAESEDLVENARQKLAEKRLDFIVANDITAPDAGFDVDTNRVTFIGRDGAAEELPLLPKREVAEKILDRLAALLKTGA